MMNRSFWPAVMVAASTLLTSVNAGESLDFARDVRPILADKCFACHGPDEAERVGGFRLDLKESALSEAESGLRPIVPGDSAASELLRRIASDDEAERMPPPESNKSLSADEIALIRRWIDAGASWKDHWSFLAPVRPPLPDVKLRNWPINEIDRLILARLEADGLTPSPAADKGTLMRRVSLDLTGLPPTPEEVDEFILDNSPDAYEKVVDRLLDSPRYGEHMARYWLDAARYGDTHGLHLDNYREMWPYRDWVVSAFNANLPYDRFTLEQLAGDLLPEPTEAQVVATGFNRCHVTTNEGGSIVDEVEVRNVVDRVVTMGTVFMGMTFDCTRCHDHKYDPFTMKDFYSLYAYFNSLDGSPMDDNREDPAPVIKVATPEQSKQLASLAGEIAALEAKLKGPWPEVDAAQARWEESCRHELLTAAEAAARGSSAGGPAIPNENSPSQLTVSDWHWVGPFGNDRRYLSSKVHGPEGKPVALTDTFELPTGEKASWVRKPEWVDGNVHTELPGESVANFLYRTIRVDKPETIKVSLGSDDAIRVYLNNEIIHDNDVDRAVAPDQDSTEMKLKAGENHLLMKIVNYQGGAGFYFKITSAHTIIPADVYEIVRRSAAERSPEEAQQLQEFFRNNLADFDELKAVRAELKGKQEARLAIDRGIATTLVWREKKEPVPARILARGEYDKPGQEVLRGTPSALPPMSPALPNNRLGLAKWLLDPSHPLTARVAVNRLWQQVFGTGIVKTSEDFGSQGEQPTHPELLDWLAVDFRENGWNVKRLMKQLVMSAAYRQSSRMTPELLHRDPANRLLARGARFRLDAETLRDQAFFASGLLVEKLGGPSVKPPQPAGLWEAVGFVSSNTEKFVPDEGPEKVHRRSLYTFIKRTSPPPQMNTFDVPSREFCVTRRERTNTPLQALVLMNEPQFVEAARALAERTLREAGNAADDRARYMFQLCVGRDPSSAELRRLIEGVTQDRSHYQAKPEAAIELTSIGRAAPPEGLDRVELAAWTLAANTLLVLDEVVTKN